MSDLGALLARLEAASEGSSELDWAVYFAATERGRQQARRTTDLVFPWPEWIECHPVALSLPTEYDEGLRAYTRSVDCALTLVPEGWGGKIMWNGSERAAGGYVELDLGPVSETGAWAALVSSYEAEDDCEEIPKAKPLPLAICIACLRVSLPHQTEEENG